MRIVEGASFIAAPLCGLTFVQLGADVIRFDPIGGGPDYNRWPLARGGASMYWEGLNKGKRSIAIDLSRDEGRELAVAIATAGGEDAGYFVTNYPLKSFLSYENLSAKRPDLIAVRVTGSSDGRNALDYTVNCATGYPFMTGSPDAPDPVNHVMPVWDVAAGLLAAVSLLAADRERRQSGKGREIVLPLSDVAFATLANLGHVAEVTTTGKDRPRLGNATYGTFGRDFVTRDGKRIMIVGFTRRQWTGLITALELQADIAKLEASLGVNFTSDEGARFNQRDALFAMIAARIGSYDFQPLTKRLDAAHAGWGLYQTVKEALDNDPRLSPANPVFQMQTHPGGETYLTAGYPGTSSTEKREPVAIAPKLGQHTDAVLTDVLGLSAAKIGELHDKGLVQGAK